jgi:hypothetical protein
VSGRDRPDRLAEDISQGEFRIADVSKGAPGDKVAGVPARSVDAAVAETRRCRVSKSNPLSERCMATSKTTQQQRWGLYADSYRA